jgi:hypothetical protein
MADANYVMVFAAEGVKVYDHTASKVIATREAVMTGWRCDKTGLWQVPLKQTIKMSPLIHCY